MSKFEFRLQRVLEYREMAEQWAKDAYLDARAARLEAVASLESIGIRRGEMVFTKVDTLADRQALENCLLKLDDDERQQKIVIDMLEVDENKRKDEWTEARKELQALQKLHDAALAEWEIEERRREQKELDEWALQRRAA